MKKVTEYMQNHGRPFCQALAFVWEGSSFDQRKVLKIVYKADIKQMKAKMKLEKEKTQ